MSIEYHPLWARAIAQQEEVEETLVRLLDVEDLPDFTVRTAEALLYMARVGGSGLESEIGKAPEPAVVVAPSAWDVLQALKEAERLCWAFSDAHPDACPCDWCRGDKDREEYRGDINFAAAALTLILSSLDGNIYPPGVVTATPPPLTL